MTSLFEKKSIFSKPTEFYPSWPELATRLMVPIDHLAELPEFLDMGVGEFYGGVIPSSWEDLFPEMISINRRTFPEAQFVSVGEMRSAITMASGAGRRFHLVLNRRRYPLPLHSLAGGLVDDLKNAGLRGVIVADPDLAITLRETFPSLDLTVSSLAATLNRGAVAFWNRLGINNFVLPRYLTVSEVTSLANAYPDSSFEVFLMMGKCPNTEGVCRFFHNHPRRVWPCVLPYRVDGSPEKPSPLRGTGWEGFARYQGCGLCSLRVFSLIPNIRFKIVGRGAATDRKRAAVAAFLKAAGCLDDSDFFGRCQNIFENFFGTRCRPANCYFPHDFFSKSDD